MRLIAGAALAALAACSNAQEPDEAGTAGEVSSDSIDLPTAPPRSEGEALLTSLTWPGLDGAGPSGPYAPRDECGEIEGSYEFRIALADAVVARDEDALVAMAAPYIKLDFGGGEGREELRERLSGEGWNLWDELETILPLGCAAYDEDSITMPWYFAQDMGDIDPYGAMIVTGENVPLYAAATGNQELRRLDWNVVTRVSFLEIVENEGPRWEVELEDRTRGFIEEERLRSVIDYRIGAVRSEDGWQIRSFVAGD